MSIILVAAAALALSAADDGDLRCYWLASKAAEQQKNAEDRFVMWGMADWFGGRLAGGHPELLVQSYILQHSTTYDVAVTDANLLACAQTFSEWQQRDIRGR